MAKALRSAMASRLGPLLRLCMMVRGSPEFERSSNARKKVEIRFAHLKVQHGFERMRLRGLTGARDEFHLAAIVQNLKTMALRLVGPPTGQIPASIA